MSAWPAGTKKANLAKRVGPLKRIHVNKHIIAANAKYGFDDPAITIQTSAGPYPCREVTWNGPSIMMHDADHPLSCGAKVWIETRAALSVSSECRRIRNKANYRKSNAVLCATTRE